jgi:type II secretory pathway component HofQ
MNLVPAVSTLSNTLLLAITPRINGDGTITLHVEVRQADREMLTESDFEAGMAAATSLASAVVNVKDGEAAGFASHCNGSWHTLIVAPRIVREPDEED